jgi:short-subunit dehydrogenase
MSVKWFSVSDLQQQARLFSNAAISVTGASRGLGLASANAYAQTGASIFICSRSAADLQKVKGKIEADYKVPVGCTTIDITVDDSVKAGVEAAIKQFGKIDVVIANGKTNLAIMIL